MATKYDKMFKEMQNEENYNQKIFVFNQIHNDGNFGMLNLGKDLMKQAFHRKLKGIQ